MGFVLTISIILLGVGIVGTVGVDQVERLQGTQNVENAERAMTVLGNNLDEHQESRAATLTSELAVHEGRLDIGPGDGGAEMTVNVSGTGSGPTDYPLGTIRYRTGDTRVVYQGGAVILENPRGESIPIRSPPFVCRGDSAVVSFVSIPDSDLGQGYSGGTGTIVSELNETDIHFPERRSGPGSFDVSTGVNVSVDSAHDAAWRDHFETLGWSNESTVSDPVKYRCEASSVYVRETTVDVTAN